MEKNRIDLVKWLQILLYIHLGSLALTLLSRLSPVLNLSGDGSWVTWLSRGLNLATVVCLFLLPMRYRSAAIFTGAWLACSLLSLVAPHHLPQLGLELYLTISSVLSWVTMALSLIALFLEYNAHAAAASSKDAPKWRILFVCYLVLLLATHVAAALLQDLLSDMVQNGITWGILLYNLVAWLSKCVFSIAYLILLARTIRNIKNKEDPYGTERRSFS